jgi:hypothetical protein
MRARAVGSRCTAIYIDDVNVVPPSHHSKTRVLSDWAELLAVTADTKIFVALNLEKDFHQEILRSLVSNGISIIIVDPNADSLFAYELQMICEESDAILQALCFTGVPAEDKGAVSQQITIRETSATKQLNAITAALTRDLIQLAQPTLGKFSLQNSIFCKHGKNKSPRSLSGVPNQRETRRPWPGLASRLPI